MTTFRDTWPKLEKWFTRFGTLKKVDSAQEEEALEHELAHVLETTMRKVGEKRIAHTKCTVFIFIVVHSSLEFV